MFVIWFFRNADTYSECADTKERGANKDCPRQIKVKEGEVIVVRVGEVKSKEKNVKCPAATTEAFARPLFAVMFKLSSLRERITSLPGIKNMAGSCTWITKKKFIKPMHTF